MDNRIYSNLSQLMSIRTHLYDSPLWSKQSLCRLLSGRGESHQKGRGTDFVELRHYSLGDDVRAIDWRVSNRTKSLHVRLFEEEKSRRIVLLVDQRQPMFFGSSWKMKSVVAAELTAMIAWDALRVDDHVGAIIFNDQTIGVFKPSRSETQLQQCFSRLIKVNNALTISNQQVPSDVTLTDVLKRAEGFVNDNDLLIVISDFNDWNHECLAAIKRLTQRLDVTAISIVDDFERDLSGAGHLVISDGHYQLVIEGKNDALMSQYNDVLAAQHSRVEQALKSQGIQMILLNTCDSLSKQLASVAWL